MAGGEAAEAPPWQAWAFLALSAVLMLAIGSASSFSFWKVGFYRHCPSWGSDDLDSLYNWCIFGGFICVPAGLMFDKIGAVATALYGLALFNVGVLGILATLLIGSEPSVTLVGFFYFLEEQGAASALYMVAVCVLVRAFPKHLVGVVTGIVAVSFGLSGLLWQTLAKQLFGFGQVVRDDTGTADNLRDDATGTNLVALWLTILVFTDVVGFAMLLTLPYMSTMFGLANNAGSASEEEESLGVGGKQTAHVSVWETLFSWNSLCLVCLYSVVSGQVIGMSKDLSSVTKAFPNLSESTFDPISFVSNVVGRIFYAVVVDSATRFTGRTGVCVGNIWINGTYILSFLLLASVAIGNSAPAGLIYFAMFLAYSSYGGSVCFASSFTKLSFPQEHVGIMIGVLFTVAAISNAVFGYVCGVGNSTNDPGINRVPADFVKPWCTSLILALLATPVVILVACKALWERDEDP